MEKLAAFFIGAMCMAGLLALTDNICTRARTALDICQEELPRNQKCVITAVPKGNNEGMNQQLSSKQ